MIDWDGMLSALEAPPPAALPKVGQRPAANESADAPAGLPGIDAPERAGDNRRRCAECRNLASNGRCLAVARRDIIASRNYAPVPDLLRRCEGFKPLASDPDQRPGRDKWPGL